MHRHDGMIARHRPGMGGGARRASGAAARMQQHDLLARCPRRARGGKETGGVANMFGDHADDGGVGLIDQIGEIILDPAGRFITGGYIAIQRHVAMDHRRRQHRGHRARLRHDAHPPVALRARWRHVDEGQRHIVAEIDEAEAIGAFHHHPRFAGDPGDFLLVSQALRAVFGKTGREDHRRTRPAPGQAAHRVQHADARDRQDRGIDAFGQVIHGRDAGPPANLCTLWVYEVNGPGKALPLQIGQHRCAERARLVRCADNRH